MWCRYLFKADIRHDSTCIYCGNGVNKIKRAKSSMELKVPGWNDGISNESWIQSPMHSLQSQTLIYASDRAPNTESIWEYMCVCTADWLIDGHAYSDEYNPAAPTVTLILIHNMYVYTARSHSDLSASIHDSWHLSANHRLSIISGAPCCSKVLGRVVMAEYSVLSQDSTQH